MPVIPSEDAPLCFSRRNLAGRVVKRNLQFASFRWDTLEIEGFRQGTASAVPIPHPNGFSR
jgi:hypothetical protein